MNKGKYRCEALKAIRKQIADANNIPYQPTQCTHKGNCLGTCQACEAEVRYIENQLDIRRLAGKTVKIVCFAASLLSATVATAKEQVDQEPIAPVCLPVAQDGLEKIEMLGDVAYRHNKKAKFIGGSDSLRSFLSKNIVYPKSAADNGIQGKVLVRFVVNTDSTISDVVVVRSVDPLLDKEAVRVVQLMSGHWMPEISEANIPVRSKFTLPINFKLMDLEEKNNQ